MTRGTHAARPNFEAALAALALYGRAYDLLLAELPAEIAASDPHARETVAALRGLSARMRQRAGLLGDDGDDGGEHGGADDLVGYPNRPTPAA